MQDMAALQTDYYAVPASILVPLFSKINSESTDEKKLIKNYLENWNYKLNKESIAAGFYVMWEKEVLNEANKLFVPENIRGLVSMQLSKVIEHIQNPALYFPAPSLENRNTFLLKCFDQAFDKMKTKFKAQQQFADFKQWSYGQLNYKHIQFEHPLAALTDSATSKKLNLQAYPRGGNGYTVGSTGSAENQQSGASFRVLMDTKDWDRTLMINTPGQSGDPNSPFYGNLLEKWANDGYFPAYFSKNKILKEAASQQIITPN